MLDFEWKVVKPIAHSGAPKISVSPRGVIGFNGSARERFRLEHWTGIRLVQAHGSPILGLQRCEPGAEGFMRLVKSKRGTYARAEGSLAAVSALPPATTYFELLETKSESVIAFDPRAGRERKRRKPSAAAPVSAEGSPF
jgi:hypothetical protein